jgi:GT2 family glycosyltransferase
MMFTIVVPAYNNPEFTLRCVESAIHSVDVLGLSTRFILIDDAATTGESTTEVFLKVRDRNSRFSFTVLRSRRSLQYPAAFSLGLHLATTPVLLFLSNDMLLTPSYLTATLAVAGLDQRYGCIRGSSRHTDGLPEHVLEPPYPVRSFADVLSFSTETLRRNGLKHVENHLPCGDAVIMRKSVVDAIGVHDTRLSPYFSDIDYGMRAQLAGFRLVGALGAWLHHEGAGYTRRDAERHGLPFAAVHHERMRHVESSWRAFRRKWGEDLPSHPSQWDYRSFALLASERRLQVSLTEPMPDWILESVDFL